MVLIAQSLGIVVSLAIAGAVFENQAVSHLAKILPDYDRNVLRNSITGKRSDFLNSIPSAATQKDVINGIVKALSSVYLVVLVAGVIVTIIGILLPVRENSQIQLYFTAHIRATSLIAPPSRVRFFSNKISY